jgi:hypothetical protein
MQIPENEKQSLGIVQSYIVFQIYVFSPKSFSIEIAISDTSRTKRRLMFSTNSKDVVINPLHCRIPILHFPIGEWVNLSIDVLSFVSDCFKSQTFRSIDNILISANCKIRRVFSMRSNLVEYNKNSNENQGFQLEYAEILPKTIALPFDVPHDNINMNMDKVRIQVENELKTSQNNMLNVNPTNNPTSPPKYKNNLKSGENFNNKGINKKSQYNMEKATKVFANNNNNIRSKSQNRPVKNSDGELFTQQEFIENYNQENDYIIYDSLSPGRMEENSTNINKNMIKGSNIKNKFQQKFINKKIPNNLQIKNINSYNPTTNDNPNKKSFKNQTKIECKSKITNNNDHIGKNTNSALLNTHNYHTIEKWENSKDNGSDSIEEIYEIDEHRTLENENKFNDPQRYI